MKKRYFIPHPSSFIPDEVPSFSWQDVSLTWRKSLVRLQPGLLQETEGPTDRRRKRLAKSRTAMSCGFDSHPFRCKVWGLYCNGFACDSVKVAVAGSTPPRPPYELGARNSKCGTPHSFPVPRSEFRVR
jgi:hypothetical protein